MKTSVKLLLILCCICFSSPIINADEPVSTLINIIRGGGKSTPSKNKAKTKTSIPKTFKIDTQHPDLKITMKRCKAASNTCIIDLIIENVGDSDINLGAANIFKTVAYDDQANQYKMDKENDSDKTFFYGIGDTSKSWWQYDGMKLLQEVPVKARIRLERVPEDAEKIVRLVWPIGIPELGLNSDKPVTFYNIPIERDSEE